MTSMLALSYRYFAGVHTRDVMIGMRLAPFGKYLLSRQVEWAPSTTSGGCRTAEPLLSNHAIP